MVLWSATKAVTAGSEPRTLTSTLSSLSISVIPKKATAECFFGQRQKANPGNQINNEEPNGATGSIEDVIQRIGAVNPAPNKWHTYVLEVRGDHIVAKLDGKKVLDGRDSKFKSGHIGLQHHKDNKIEFRNVILQPLNS